MLQKHAVPGPAMDVLNFLSAQDFLNEFRLVGGTGLALYWGHRRSVDIDLFTDKKLSVTLLEHKLTSLDGAVQVSKNPIGLMYEINSIKCDFLIYPYSFLFNEITEDGIRIAHIEDIIALKLGAIANRGAMKDFVDLYYMLDRYSITDLLFFYSRMYKVNEHFSLLKSMTYFEDAENELLPKLFIDKTLTWEKIKKTIISKVATAL